MSSDMLGKVVRKLVQVPAVMLGMLYDLLEKLCGPDGDLWHRELGKFLRKETPFASTDIRQEWQEFYRRQLGLSVDFSGVQIPEEKEDFTRILFIPEGLTINRVLQALKKHFPVCIYADDLDRDVTENVRNTQQSYALRVRDCQEADEELQNLSANDLQEQNINCLTLLERLVYEWKYYSETGQHLDVHNWTICAGSRDRDGSVPGVDWNAGNSKFYVRYYHPSFAHGPLRGRAVVSC